MIILGHPAPDLSRATHRETAPQFCGLKIWTAATADRRRWVQAFDEVGLEAVGGLRRDCQGDFSQSVCCSICRTNRDVISGQVISRPPAAFCQPPHRLRDSSQTTRTARNATKVCGRSAEPAAICVAQTPFTAMFTPSFAVSWRRPGRSRALPSFFRRRRPVAAMSAGGDRPLVWLAFVWRTRRR